MLVVYIGCLAFAAVLIGATVLLGHHDMGDAHHDVAHAHADEGHAAPSLPFLSLRFWTYALGAFGLSGLLLRALGAPAAVHVPVAAGAGVGVGLAVTWALRALARRTGGSPANLEEARGAEAVVLLPVSPEKDGKVRLRLGEQDVDLPARPMETETFAPHDRVLVVSVEGGVARVARAPWRENGT